MNLIQKLSEDVKEYFKPENVKERLEREIEMETLKIKRDKIKMQRDKITKERWKNKPQFKMGMD
jgi:hypothetical protein